MPPEQLAWDRRDFRKHERSGSDPRVGGGFGGGGSHRWREQHQHPHAPPPHPPPYHHNNHHQQQRWYSHFRSSRPIPSGHGKQGGWHMYPDVAGHEFLPSGSRYSDRNLEDDNFRPLGNRVDVRYFRNSRENRGSFNQRDWRSASWEPAASSSSPGRPINEVSNQKSTENSETCHETSNKSSISAHPLPDSLPGQSQSVLKGNNEKNSDTADGLVSLDQKSEKENCLGSVEWEPLKWNRSGSFSSRSSGLSHSSGVKSFVVDSVVVVDVQDKNALPLQSPAAICVVPTAAPALSDETSSRKKPRLGWGEGLAKYEKKKVGPDEVLAKDVPVTSSGDTETMQLLSLNLLDKSPRVASFSSCTSPATPSSVACSYSPGTEEKESINTAKIDHGAANLSSSPSTMSQSHYDGPTFNLESLELSSIAHLSSSINELLQHDNQSPAGIGYDTSLNKLLVWKVNILKALEVTESEIDSLETELKSLVAEPTSSGPNPVPPPSRLRPDKCHLKSCQDRVTDSSITIAPATSQFVSSVALTSENLPAAMENERAALKDEEIDSPGSATSKLIGVMPSGEDIFPSEIPQHDQGSVVFDRNNSGNLEKCLENCRSNQDESCGSDDHELNERNCHNSTSVGNVYYDINHIYHPILSANRDSVDMAMEELNKLLPAQPGLFCASTASNFSSLQKDSSIIKERFLKKKRFLKFKKKVITVKFKALQHFWKEGRVVSIRELQGKSHKKFGLSHTGCKKNRSSGRYRFCYTAGSPQTASAEEVIELVNRLLSESPFKPCRNTSKMPALILDKEVRLSRFISNNALVEDPFAVEKERSTINPWTAEERELFIDKLAIFGKDFTKIASFLEHKTVADCIEFYYKNHKSESFARARKKPDFRKQRKPQPSTYLVAAGKRWSCEANAASLDILGEASLIAATINDRIESQQKCTSKISIGPSGSHKAPKEKIEDVQLLRSHSFDMFSNEIVAADVLAGICGSLSSEAMSSCITTSVDLIDGYQDQKNQRVGSYVKWPLTPDVTQIIDDECSDESCGEMDPTDWTDEEKSIFIHSVSLHGKDFLEISRCVGTKSREQCKIFFGKARKCLGLDCDQARAVNFVSSDVNGGVSDTEDACVVQACPDVCNDCSECNMEEHQPPPDMNSTHVSDIGGENDMEPDSDIYADDKPSSSLDSMAVLVSKNLSTGDTVVDDSPAADINVDCNDREGANSASGCLSEVRTLTVSSMGVKEADCVRTVVLNDADNQAVAEVSDGHHGEDNGGQTAFPSEDNPESKSTEVKDANSTEVAVMCGSVNGTKSKYQVEGIISNLCIDAHSSFHNESGLRIEDDLQTCNAEKSRAISFEQNGHFTSMESSTLFSVPIKYQRHSRSDARSSGGNIGASEKKPEKLFSIVDCQPHISGYSPLDPVDHSRVLRGYPIPMHTLKEMNGDINGKKHLLLQHAHEKLHSDQCTEFSFQKCSQPKHHGELAQAPFPSQDRSRDQYRPRSGSLSDADKLPTNGDVKLFGKILASSRSKPDSCLQGDGGQHHKPDYQTLNLRFSQKANLDCSLLKFDHGTAYPGSGNIPIRSYGFWDGNRKKKGFPHLPNSDHLFAKYPATFSAHSTLAHRLKGTSVYPVIEISGSNGAADYPALRNRELEHLALDIKQSQEVLVSEMRRRNKFEMGPGMQQQHVVGIDIGGGFLFGGQCSGVSDPVAAIKMHYTKAQNLSMQVDNGVRDNDTWTSKGDVGSW